MKLLACGDSWTWGDELVDPLEEPIPIMQIPGGGFDRHLKPVNEAYRMKYRYVNQLAKKIDAEVVDLSQCSISNNAIVRKLIDYLSEEDYLYGRDTSDLFVNIGWTSPERTEFYYKKKWGGDNWLDFGPWTLGRSHNNKDVDEFFKIYVENFYHPGEYLRRWILQIWQTEKMLKSLNIKYLMHQAFYHHHMQTIRQWADKRYQEEIKNTITLSDKKMWDSIDKVRFMYKDNPEIGTAHHYMLSKVDGDHSKVFIEMHPNAHGHTLWADHIYDYCKEHNIL